MAELTDQQSQFVTHFVANGGNGSAAAVAAGYAEASSRQAAYKLGKLPHVQNAIRDEQRRMLSGELSNMALATLKGILADEESPYGARVDAAKAVLDRGGLVAPKASAPQEADTSKKIDQMTLDELNAFIRDRTAEIARSRPSTPSAVPNHSSGDDTAAA